MKELLTVKEASQWATKYLNRKVSPSNIMYLIQYGRVKKIGKNGTILIKKNELISYYKNSYNGKREVEWKSKLGDDLNWHLSFDYLIEVDTTKHVHRLHPYKGKFIPQLVEYFLDDHTDEFKKQVYFKKGVIILDPFCGSGTTLYFQKRNRQFLSGNKVVSFASHRLFFPCCSVEFAVHNRLRQVV